VNLRLTASLPIILLASVGAVHAQHSKTKPPDVGGGKTEITLPVPTGVTRSAGRAPAVIKQTLQLVTRNDDGTWYYTPAVISREANITKLIVGFVPKDLTAERRRLASEYWNIDRVKADAFLSYISSIYSVELLCASGQYRFTAGIQVSADRFLGEEELSQDWREWRDTEGTPWEAVRQKVCR
jgi:hypothetical protein